MNILQINKTKLLISILIQALFFMPVFAIDLDYTVDDTIRKNYNVEAGVNGGVKESLPKLPNPPNTVKSTPTKTYTKPAVVQKQTKPRSQNTLPLRKGMEIDILNINAISDKQKSGTNIVFTAKRPIKTAYYTIPQGTKFVGKIVESHTPQITGNGGLVSIEVITIILGGQYQHIDSRITKVGENYVFFEDIKGKRSYWKNTVSKGKWGRRTFHKMNKLSANLLQDKPTIILAPFTFVYGVAMGGISTLTSPVVSIFCKGGNVYIPVNTTFRIKLEKDVKLYY